ADHHDRPQARPPVLERVGHQDSALLESEHHLAGQEALNSLVIRHSVLFFPRWSGADGIPPTARLTKLFETTDAQRGDAERVRDLALRQAANMRLKVRPLAPEAVVDLLRRTPLSCPEGTFFDGEGVIGGRHHRYAALSGLPAVLSSGAVISALTRAHIRGGVSLLMFPVDSSRARKELKA